MLAAVKLAGVLAAVKLADVGKLADVLAAAAMTFAAEAGSWIALAAAAKIVLKALSDLTARDRLLCARFQRHHCEATVKAAVMNWSAGLVVM